MRETMPRWTASRASSAEDQRDSGLRDSAGSVHARAVIWARWVEGKKAWSARPRGFLHARTVSAGGSPLPDGGDIAPTLPSQRDIVPGRMLIREHQNFGPHHLGMGRFAQASDVLQASVFLRGQSDEMLRFGPSGHQIVPPLAGTQGQCTTDSSSENPLRIHCQVY